MNQQQLKYARERAHGIYQHRLAKIRATPAGLTTEEKYAALKKGKFTVDPSQGHYGWYHAVQFNDEPVVDEVAVKKATKALANKYNTLLDELVLGDQETALQLLRHFDV